MTPTLITLQARMMQNAIAYWQSMFVMQKQWFESMARMGQPQDAATQPPAEPMPDRLPRRAANA
ncbi:MAG: hypothetical protein QM656_17310 [Paracoccaceae bacterium]